MCVCARACVYVPGLKATVYSILISVMLGNIKDGLLIPVQMSVFEKKVTGRLILNSTLTMNRLITNSMAYRTRRFDAAFTRALQ